MGDVLSGGSSRPATAEELEFHERMRQSLAQMPVPTLQHRDNPHEYLFFALFDGTGQDVNDPDQLPTNVGVLANQLQVLEDEPSNRIGGHYVKGIGTQDNPITRIRDKAFAHTWDERIEEMYREFAERAAEWQRQDPQAQIRIAEVGYSRGAVLVPGFARLVDQYGIVDPDDLKFGRDQHGNITIETTRPPLVPPGQVAQAVGLFDPVATNFPKNYDARLPPSVISGVSLLAEHEQRQMFPYQTIIRQEMTADGRFFGAIVPGGHSNAGGGNRENGLEILAGNGMIDYLNRLGDRPLFEKRPVPTDPAMFTVYQAQGVTAGFGTRMDRDGQRDLREELANCKIVDPCRDSEPLNTELARQFPRRYVGTEPAQTMPVEQQPWVSFTPNATMAAPVTPRFGESSPQGANEGARERTIDVDRKPDNAIPTNTPTIPGATVPAPERTRLDDPRNQGHPEHAMVSSIREQIVKLHVQAGQPTPQGEDLERLTAGVALSSRQAGMQQVHGLTFGYNYQTGQPDYGKLLAANADPDDPARRRSATLVQAALQTSPEQAYQQMAQATLQQEQQLAQQREQQWRVDAQRQQPAGPVLS